MLVEATECYRANVLDGFTEILQADGLVLMLVKFPMQFFSQAQSLQAAVGLLSGSVLHSDSA